MVWQQDSGSCIPVTVTTSFEGVSQMRVGDINRDGAPDLLADAIHDDESTWFESTGSGASVEHTIATAFDVYDLDIELRRAALSLTDATGAPVTEAPAGGLFASVRIWHDADESGLWGAGVDALLLDVAPSLPSPGQLLLELPPGGPVILADEGSAADFLVLATTADASAHLPDGFRVEHLPGDSSMARHLDDPTIPTTVRGGSRS
jgi:hypothetical protein